MIKMSEVLKLICKLIDFLYCVLIDLCVKWGKTLQVSFKNASNWPLTKGKYTHDKTCCPWIHPSVQPRSGLHLSKFLPWAKKMSWPNEDFIQGIDKYEDGSSNISGVELLVERNDFHNCQRKAWRRVVGGYNEKNRGG